MASKLREYDEFAEKIVNEFLEKNFYHKYCSNYVRYVDKSNQVIGIDTSFSLNGSTYYCDEKSAIRYANKNLQTFSLELSFINRKGNLSNGWLVDDNKKNDSYLFCWIDKSIKDKFTSYEDLLDVEISLVKKNRIIEYLSEIGWSLEKLNEKSKRIRSNRDEYCGDINSDGIKFSKSFQLYEKPINILIKRKKLAEISDFNKKIIIDKKK